MLITTVTQKGQVTVPQDIRLSLGLVAGSQVFFTEEDGYAGIRLLPSLESLRGSIKPKYKNLSLQKRIKLEEDAAEKEAIREYSYKTLRLSK